MVRTAVKGRVVNEIGVVLPTLSVADATLEQLQDRLASTFRAENQAAAVRAETLAELTRREGVHLTENTLRETGLRPRRKARSEVETARELEELPKTSEGLREGKIPYETPGSWRRPPSGGRLMKPNWCPRLVPSPRTSSRERSVSMSSSVPKMMGCLGWSTNAHGGSPRSKTAADDGMKVLYGRFDPVTGALIETTLSRKMDELWREEDPRARRTPGQRMADALAGLVTREDTDEEGSPPRGPRLLLIADYDVVSRELRNGRLGDGTPIPVENIRDLACQSDILPAIFRGVSQPLDLGRSRRTASTAQRIALIARDKACVGYGATANWCQGHHMTPWAVEGNTDIDDMCLLCSRCHHRVHDDQWVVRRAPTGKYSLRPPLKHHRRTPTPPRIFNPHCVTSRRLTWEWIMNVESVSRRRQRIRPGEVRDAIEVVLGSDGGEMSVKEIHASVEVHLARVVPGSSVRSYLNLNAGSDGRFRRVRRGVYRLT